MAGATFSRVKTWIAEVLTASDLNAEFDNILNNLLPAGVDDECAQSTFSPLISPSPLSPGERRNRRQRSENQTARIPPL